MAVMVPTTVLHNDFVEGGFHSMRVPFTTPCEPGQFVLLRIDGHMDPFLGRPICVFDWADGILTLLYQVVGRGTAQLSKLIPGERVIIQGPLGKGFPLTSSNIALIGGGVGIAPLYMLAKTHRKRFPGGYIRIHLGFREQPVLEGAFRSVCNALDCNIGGRVTDDVDFTVQDRIYYACGPTPMMRAAAEKAKEHGATLYLSLEERMGCGVGACLSCVCETTKGMKCVCKDGPVFLSSEVF